jgi:hypothetical protein
LTADGVPAITNRFRLLSAEGQLGLTWYAYLEWLAKYRCFGADFLKLRSAMVGEIGGDPKVPRVLIGAIGGEPKVPRVLIDAID